MQIPTKEMIERFFRYVKIDTQSDENSTTYPSTAKQLDLSRLLEKELKALGLKDVKMTQHGYVFGTLPSNLKDGKQVPTIGYIAHVDTSPDVSGENVEPVVHKNYQGGNVVLPKDKTQILNTELDPALKNCIGHDIITSNGTTLLGADNKAGVAEILTAMQYFIDNPDVPHGNLRVGITVDEEVGTGTQYFDIKEFGAKYAYTIDGETAGEIEDETFCADSVTMILNGINIHPGYAKDRMVNASKILAEVITRLPKDSTSPETTEKREGYIHPNSISGGVEKAEIKFLIRDFTVEGLKEKEAFLEKLMNDVVAEFPGATGEFIVDESYRNMRYVLDKYPFVVDYALEAVERSNLKPHKNLIRGGTDGARLSYMGVPTPNIFTGGHNFHSKREWVTIQDMEKAVETIVNLSIIWAEKGEPSN